MQHIMPHTFHCIIVIVYIAYYTRIVFVRMLCVLLAAVYVSTQTGVIGGYMVVWTHLN